MMKKLVLGLVAGGAALAASSAAQAADSVVTREYYSEPAPIVENTRTMCDQFGRCWRELTIVESYAYAPRPPAVVEQRIYERPARYVERPYVERAAPVYREAPEYYEAPSAGVGVYAPGVSLGVGLNSW